jgi:hypothetical protein
MTEIIDEIQMKIVYDKFIALRLKQKIANEKYRHTEHGRAKTNEMHKNWLAKNKNKEGYRENINMKSKERYHKKKLEKLGIMAKIKELKELENEIVLGESDIPNQKIGTF